LFSQGRGLARYEKVASINHSGISRLLICANCQQPMIAAYSVRSVNTGTTAHFLAAGEGLAA
jgi:hypothetical protein